MSRPVALSLSPHLDDAAFSCGGTLARLARENWRVVVATLFTESVPEPRGFALACQLDKGLGPDIDYMALRRDEDRTATVALGAEPVWLPFREAPHRGYGSAPALFADVRADDDDVAGELARAVAALVAECRPDLVLAPQAIGGHVDHVQTVRAIDAAGLAAPVAWWRDFPYAAREGEPKAPYAARMNAMPARAVRLDAAAQVAKRDAARAYASQIGFQFGGPAGLDAKLAVAGAAEWFAADTAAAALLPADEPVR